MHPGDVQKLRAVNRAELHSFENVVVLPTVGTQSVAANCSGGDLDGDKFSVIWASDLVPPDRCMQPALDYDAVLAEAGPAVGALENGAFNEDDLVHFFCRVVVNDTLGKIAHMHLAYCDACEQGWARVAPQSDPPSDCNFHGRKMQLGLLRLGYTFFRGEGVIAKNWGL